MNNSTLLMLSLGFWALITISSSWAVAWLLIEINTILFLTSIINEEVQPEATAKYFFLQSLASLCFLISQLASLWAGEATNFLVFLSLCLNSGVGPFYAVYLAVVEELNFFNMCFYSSAQKVAPATFMVNYISSIPSYVFDFLFLVTIIIVALDCINQTSIPSFVFLSSTSNLCWIIISAPLGESWWLFFWWYAVSFLPFLILLYEEGLSSFWSLVLLPSGQAGTIVLFLAAASGTPPSTFFSFKWIITEDFLYGNGLLNSVLLLVPLGLSFFYFVRLLSMLFYNVFLLFFSNNNKYPLLMISLWLSLGLVFCLWYL